ncbi:MAG: S-layer homology domain-containing protein [Lutispora sp.]|nr:S-layer homology domain-containing protein [Lutispora sp.]
MLKRFSAIIMVFVLVFSGILYVSAESTLPTSLEKPQDIAIRSEGASQLSLRWTNPESIIKIVKDIEDGEYDAALSYLVDWKKNDGSWNIAIPSSHPNWEGNVHGYFSGNMPNVMTDERNVAETIIITWYMDPSLDGSSTYDLENDTYHFRVRYLLEPHADEMKAIYSPYSEVAVIGKNAISTTITKLDAPQDLKVGIKKDSSDKPYFQLDWVIPESITQANKQLPVYHFIDFKVGNGKWLSETTKWDGMPGAVANLLTSSDTLNPVEKNLVDKVVIEENIYYFRVAFVCEPPMGNPVISPYSNIASTKIAAYSDASSWAKPEIDEADKNGLIPDSLKGADMTKPITREEFAELTVKLYERTTGKTVLEVSSNPFTDTKNPEILKAYGLGITTGTSATTFTPKNQINREQVASMLSRAIRIMVPGADFSTAGAPTFTDEKNISSWALEHVKYMSKLEIIKGAVGKFMPKAVTSAEIASGYANTTREQAIAMSLRTFNKFGK